MIIRCWGARGSIPVSGRQYLHYGGNTTCLEIRTKDDEILIVDAGVKKLGLFHHNQERFDAEIDVLVTECHKAISQRGNDLECFAVSQSMELVL